MVAHNSGCCVGGCDGLLLFCITTTHARAQMCWHWHACTCTRTQTATHNGTMIVREADKPQMLPLHPPCRGNPTGRHSSAWCCCTNVSFPFVQNGFSFSLHLHSFMSTREVRRKQVHQAEYVDMQSSAICKQKDPTHSAGNTLSEMHLCPILAPLLERFHLFLLSRWRGRWEITQRGKPSSLWPAHQHASFNCSLIFIIHLPLAMNYSTLVFPHENCERWHKESWFPVFTLPSLRRSLPFSLMLKDGKSSPTPDMSTCSSLKVSRYKNRFVAKILYYCLETQTRFQQLHSWEQKTWLISSSFGTKPSYSTIKKRSQYMW